MVEGTIRTSDEKPADPKPADGDVHAKDPTKKVEALVEQLVAQGKNEKEVREAVAAMLNTAQHSNPELSAQQKRDQALQAIIDNPQLITDPQAREQAFQKQRQREEEVLRTATQEPVKPQGQSALEQVQQAVTNPEKVTAKAEPQADKKPEPVKQETQPQPENKPATKEPENKKPEPEKPANKEQANKGSLPDKAAKQKVAGGKGPKKGGGGKSNFLERMAQQLAEIQQRILDMLTQQETVISKEREQAKTQSASGKKSAGGPESEYKPLASVEPEKLMTAQTEKTPAIALAPFNGVNVPSSLPGAGGGKTMSA